MARADRRNLDLELEEETEAREDHPARRIFSGAKGRSAASKKSGATRSASKSGRRKKVSRVITVEASGIKQAYAASKRSDRDVYDYLKGKQAGGKAVVAGIPEIASSAGVSARQVQISIGRLIQVGLLERLGYDFGNADLSKRGTIYKVIS